jgi:phosphonate transport system substrate-binding protein
VAQRDSSKLRFALPSTVGADVQVARFETALSDLLKKKLEVVIAPTYENLARELLSGKVDAAWAPPFVCARIEAMGIRVIARGVRKGSSTYRAAILAKKGSGLSIDVLSGKRAVWSDRDSVGGYLLPMALLREKKFDVARLFASQEFVGQYKKALEMVLAGQADITSVFAPGAKVGNGNGTGVSEIWNEKVLDFEVLGFTEESPNDGVAVSLGAPTALTQELEAVLVKLVESDPGKMLLNECFHADRFEPAPRMGYRALYRVALASL